MMFVELFNLLCRLFRYGVRLAHDSHDPESCCIDPAATHLVSMSGVMYTAILNAKK
jgi:hypothetical protein